MLWMFGLKIRFRESFYSNVLDVGLYLFVRTHAINFFELKRPFSLETSYVAVIPKSFSMLGGVGQRKLYAQQSSTWFVQQRGAAQTIRFSKPHITRKFNTKRFPVQRCMGLRTMVVGNDTEKIGMAPCAGMTRTLPSSTDGRPCWPSCLASLCRQPPGPGLHPSYQCWREWSSLEPTAGRGPRPTPWAQPPPSPSMANSFCLMLGDCPVKQYKNPRLLRLEKERREKEMLWLNSFKINLEPFANCGMEEGVARFIS